MARELAGAQGSDAVRFDRKVELVSVLPKILVEAPEGRMPLMVVKCGCYLSVIAGPLVAAYVGEGWHRRPAWLRLENVDLGSEEVLRFESMDRVQAWIGRTLLAQFQGELAESIVR
ncbi:hypothetical protein DF132_23265 [Burkholderia cenocepacia]|nr:hypothetical protein DF132_23265 [Burkholderia cenocepacia]